MDVLRNWVCLSMTRWSSNQVHLHQQMAQLRSKSDELLRSELEEVLAEAESSLSHFHLCFEAFWNISKHFQWLSGRRKSFESCKRSSRSSGELQDREGPRSKRRLSLKMTWYDNIWYDVHHSSSLSCKASRWLRLLRASQQPEPFHSHQLDSRESRVKARAQL